MRTVEQRVCRAHAEHAHKRPKRSRIRAMTSAKSGAAIVFR
jgi:hypothetical protein